MTRPKPLALLLCVLFSMAASQPQAQTIDPLAPTGRWPIRDGSAARTPPMGWSSWNAFRTEITEDKVIGAAEALVSSGLAKRGYVYVNIDDGWWLQRRASDGRLQVRTQLFPSAVVQGSADTSFRPFVDRIHGLGLKAGIYTDIGRNACSQAYDLESPNLPVGSTREREVGLYGHVDQDIQLFLKDWKFDYLKVDACGLADFGADQSVVAAHAYRPMPPAIVRGRPAQTDASKIRGLYEEVAAAIRRHDPANAAFLSICAWGQADVRQWGKDVGQSWRTGEDITPSWSSLLQSFDSAAGRALYAHPGAWNDPDMLFIGAGEFDEHHLTEARSHFSLWAIINAPLLIGYDLRQAPQALLDIWGNSDVIAINQDPAGHQGVLAYSADDLQIIVKTLSDGSKAVALFNRSATSLQATLTADHLKFAKDAPIAVREVWNQQALPAFTGEMALTLAPHETRLLRVNGKRQLPGALYLSELPGLVNVAVDGVRQSELDPTIRRGMSPWSGSRSDGERPVYSGWGGAQADSAPYGTALAVGGRSFASGIGILSGSRIQIKNERRFARFTASVGIDDSTRNRKGSVRFSIYGDGRLLAHTRELAFGQAPVALAANVAGVNIIELVARTHDGSAQPVSTAWGSAALSEAAGQQ